MSNPLPWANYLKLMTDFEMLCLSVILEEKNIWNAYTRKSLLNINEGNCQPPSSDRLY
jgi:hypothetical protein